MRIICAIPHFNQSTTLEPLVRQLLKEPFDEVYVLDDASDDNHLDFLRNFKSKRLNVIYGTDRRGPAGNRNRLLQYERHGVVWFIDADMAVESKSNHYHLEKLFTEHRRHGIFGGLIQDASQTQIEHNFDYFHSPLKHIAGNLLSSLHARSRSRQLQSVFEELAKPYTYRIYIREHPPRQMEVPWANTGNFSMRLELFQELGGFNTRNPHGGSQDLCRRVWQAGFKVGFTPQLETTHDPK